MIICFFEDTQKELQRHAELRHVTVNAIIVKDGKILLTKRAPHLLHGDKYAYPGGFIDRNETAEEAVRREVKEEAGYGVTKTTLFRINDYPFRKGEDRQNIDFIFIAEVGDKVGKPDHEVTDVQWFPLDNLPQEELFAFDQYENIQLFLKYQKEQFPLPIVGKLV